MFSNVFRMFSDVFADVFGRFSNVSECFRTFLDVRFMFDLCSIYVRFMFERLGVFLADFQLFLRVFSRF